MYKQVTHKMEEGANPYAVITHSREECECSPRRVVGYRNVGKPGATVVVTFIHKG